jgi:hypothetical protein
MLRSLIIPTLILVLGCGNALGPAKDLSGTWAAIYSFPGSSMVLTLRQVGDSIAGTGTYQAEAGPGGMLQVVGMYHRPSVSLTLQFGPGQDEPYIGTVLDDSHISGALGSFSLPFVRR